MVKAGFQVTTLSRSNSNNEPNIQIVDYGSIQSLTDALVGHDAIVSTISVAGWAHQRNLIDAAVKAGSVKHFIPSDFTALSTNPEVAHLPYYKDAVAIQKLLKDKAEKAGMKWTVVVTGPILGCVLNGSYAYNFQEQTALHVSDGDHRVSMTRGHTIGKAIASILSKSERIESGPICIHDVVTSQNEILQTVEKISGKKWPLSHIDGEEKLCQGLEMFNNAQGNPPIFATFLVIHNTIFGGKYNTAWDGKGNELLELPMLSSDAFEDLLAQRIRNEPIDGGLPWNSAPKPRS